MEQIKVKAERQGLSMEMDRETFAMALKTWRLRQGLTQEQLGEKWGMTRFGIIRIEKAKPVSWETAYKVFAKLSNELTREAAQDNEVYNNH